MTTLERVTRWAAIIIIIAAFVYIICPASKKMYPVIKKLITESRVLTDEEKQAHFARIGNKVFTGKEGRRPPLVVRDTRGKLEVYNEDEKKWIKI